VAERLRQAKLARAAEAARAVKAKATAAQKRRSRRLTLAWAASVLLPVTAGAADGLWAQRLHAERAAEETRKRHSLQAALDKAIALRQQAHWAVAEQTRDRPGDTGPDDLRQRVRQAAVDSAQVDRIESIRLKRSTIVEGDFAIHIADQDYAVASRGAGLGREGEEAEGVTERVSAAAVREDWSRPWTTGPRWPATSNGGRDC
jgi:hypothetical protein